MSGASLGALLHALPWNSSRPIGMRRNLVRCAGADVFVGARRSCLAVEQFAADRHAAEFGSMCGRRCLCRRTSIMPCRGTVRGRSACAGIRFDVPAPMPLSAHVDHALPWNSSRPIGMRRNSVRCAGADVFVGARRSCLAVEQFAADQHAPEFGSMCRRRCLCRRTSIMPCRGTVRGRSACAGSRWCPRRSRTAWRRATGARRGTR